MNRDLHFWFFSAMMASPLGQYLIKRRNFFVNGVMPRAVGTKGALTEEVMEHYRRAQPTSSPRRRPTESSRSSKPSCSRTAVVQPHFTLELFDFLLDLQAKRKDHVAMFPFTEAEVTEAGFIESFTDACCKSSPYMHFLTTAVGLPY